MVLHLGVISQMFLRVYLHVHNITCIVSALALGLEHLQHILTVWQLLTVRYYY